MQVVQVSTLRWRAARSQGKWFDTVVNTMLSIRDTAVMKKLHITLPVPHAEALSDSQVEEHPQLLQQLEVLKKYVSLCVEICSLVAGRKLFTRYVSQIFWVAFTMRKRRKETIQWDLSNDCGKLSSMQSKCQQTPPQAGQSEKPWTPVLKTWPGTGAKWRGNHTKF